MEPSPSAENLSAQFKTAQDVADALKIDLDTLRYFSISKRSSSLYKTFNVPKKSGGSREISAPNHFWKNIQRKLADILIGAYETKAVVHGFAMERSVCTNARIHVKRRFVLNVDLQDFFPSINFGRVRGMFLKPPYNCAEEVATLLAQICSCRNQLPQGAPTSPIVSNMLCSTLDSHLRKLASQYHCSYSRYVDDLTFSTNKINFPEDLAKVKILDGKEKYFPGEKLISVIERNGFKINPNKFRLQLYHQRQEVTGLITNQKVNVHRTYVREIRALLHKWKTDGLNACQIIYEAKLAGHRFRHPNSPVPLFKNFVKGKIDYLTMVRGNDDPIVIKFLRELAALEPAFVDLSVLPKEEDIEKLLDQCWLIEVINPDRSINQGTGFSLKGYGIITCSHVLGGKGASIKVTSRDMKSQFEGKILHRDGLKDIAILDIGIIPASYLEASTTRPKRLAPITVLGFPNFNEGDTGNAHTGKVTGFRRNDFYGSPFILVDALIMTGNSGGPVLDSFGKVIGIAARGGADQMEARKTEFNGVVPISELEEFKKS